MHIVAFMIFYFALMWMLISPKCVEVDPFLVGKAVLYFAAIKILILFARKQMINQRSPFLLISAFGSVILYSLLLTPKLNPIFGGYVVSPVKIVRDNHKEEKWLLIYSDTHSAVLSKEANELSFWKAVDSGVKPQVSRVSWSEIKLLTSRTD